MLTKKGFLPDMVKIPKRVLDANIPYMGGKRDISYSLVMAMHRRKPEATVFYDLFGGGGAMSFMALQFGYRVIYNEINTGMCNLVVFLRENGIPSEWRQWVGNEKFQSCLGKTDAYSQFVASCWSFGNNGSGYIYGKDKENIKRHGHNYVVDACEESRLELNGLLGLEIPRCEAPDPRIRRLFLKRFLLKANKTRQGELQHLQHLQRLQHLEHLQHFEHLQRLERLEVRNMPYNEVTIDTPFEQTIVYCDPPYRGTAKYNRATRGAGYDFDHAELDGWFGRLPFTAFMSECESPHECILKLDKRVLLSSTDNKTVKTEKLYWNGR